MKIAIFPGSFDPFTIGHYDIVKRALTLFDKIVIGIGQNQAKQSTFSLTERLERIEKAFADESRVVVTTYDGLTVDFARKHGATHIVRGVRSTIDFEYERSIAEANRQLSGIETVLLYTSPEYGHISSTLVRDLHAHGREITNYLPKLIDTEL
jgi:pantetheine-phosphate adenylyltransferase